MLTQQTSRLVIPLIYSLAAIVIRSTWDHALAAPVSWALWAAAMCAGVTYLADKYLAALTRWRQAQAITKEVELAQSLSKLNSDQVELFKAILQQPVTTESIGVPPEWIANYLKAADGFYLKPVRSYPEGSKDRLYAQTIINYLVDAGAVRPPAGPYPARVIHWREVTEALGW